MSRAQSIQQRLSGYVEQAKQLAHDGERGAVAEAVVMQALREILPGRFSLGTGFLQTASDKWSNQQDIVVYDALDNTPTLLPGGLGIFPIECVYATVEVTLTASAEKVRKTLEAVAKIRDMAKEKVYVRHVAVKTPGVGTIGQTEHFTFKPPLAPRAFFFAVNTSVTQGAIEDALRSRPEDAHLHGALFLNDNWFYAHRAYKAGLAHTPEHAFATFLMKLRTDIESFPMATGFIGPYLGAPPVELKLIDCPSD